MILKKLKNGNQKENRGEVMKGYVKLYRKLLENPVFKNPELLQLFLYCLLRANHKKGKAFFGSNEIELDKGQFVTGRFELATALGQNASSTYKRLQKLEFLTMVGLQSNNKNTIVTITNWELYQSSIEDKDNDWTTDGQESNRKVAGEGQESNTNKNGRSNLLSYINQYGRAGNPPVDNLEIIDVSNPQFKDQTDRKYILINNQLHDVTGLTNKEITDITTASWPEFYQNLKDK